jgi:hypothetical protein
MNQAVKLSIAENGTTEGWLDVDAKYAYYDGTWLYAYWVKYLQPYMKMQDVEKLQTGILARFADGSAVAAYNVNSTPPASIRMNYCVRYKDCKTELEKHHNYPNTMKCDTRNIFYFFIGSYGLNTFEYTWGNTKRTRESLLNDSSDGCATGTHNFCSGLIRNDGWKISDDYPW